MFGIHTRLMKIYYKHLANQDITARVIKDWNPDSNFRCRKFPEAGRLWKEWTKDNETNNCVDFSRFYSLLLNLDYVLRGGVSGALAELGVYKASSAVLLKYFADKYERDLYLYDTFEGFDTKDLHGLDKKHKKEFMDTSLDYVKNRIGQANFRKGFFPDYNFSESQ